MALNFFRVSKGLSVKPQASAPSSPSNGDIYYNSTSNQFQKYENGAWGTFGSGAAPSLTQNKLFIGDDSNIASAVDTSYAGNITAAYQIATVTFQDTGHADGNYVCIWNSNPLAEGDTVYFTGGTLPTGLTASTKYYATDCRLNTFKLMEDLTYVVKTFTGSGSGTIKGVSTGLDTNEKIYLVAPTTATLYDLGNRNVLKGDSYTVVNTATYKATIRSYNNDVLAILDSKYSHATFICLTSLPTTQNHWRVIFNHDPQYYECDVGGGAKDVAYNGGIKATIGNASTVPFGRLVAYQTPTGVWRMKINFWCTVSSASRTAADFTFNGVNFGSGVNQICAGSLAGSTGWLNCVVFVGIATDSLRFIHPSSTTDNYACHIDIELAAKPTWAY